VLFSNEYCHWLASTTRISPHRAQVGIFSTPEESGPLYLSSSGCTQKGLTDSKGPAFDAAKYRNNPKMIATYLNNALATDDPAFTIRAIGSLARAPTGWGPLPKRRT
jgi:hypothetical protein